MDTRAAACGAGVASDGFVFSLDPTCNTPLRPELLTRCMRRLRNELGVIHDSSDATTLTLCKATTSELMDAGSIPPP